jgi:hypothetical protein
MSFGHLQEINQISGGRGMQQIKTQGLPWPGTTGKERMMFFKAV